jgi:hypothetical protein
MSIISVHGDEDEDGTRKQQRDNMYHYVNGEDESVSIYMQLMLTR